KTGTSSDYVDAWYMGITKDLVTGVWVGCDERTAHFKNSETGEASRTALPIFAKFMEKVYHDETSGYTYGPFPKPTVKINIKYNCPTPRYVPDTTTQDSVVVDSVEQQMPVIEELDPLTPEQMELINQQQKRAGNPAPVQPANTQPLSKKEERELKRKLRKEEKEKAKLDPSNNG